jgi:LysM repeat protein
MKILQIFGAVVAVHVLAFIFIFASPGCQSGPRNIPTPDATAPYLQPSAPVTFNAPTPVDMGTAPAAPASTSGYATPTRPGSPNAAAYTPAPKPVAEVAAVATYTVTKGDSLWSIAKKHNMSVAELARTNNLTTSSTLQPGKKLIVPGKSAPAPAQDLAVAPAVEKTVAPANPSASGETTTYTVQSGDKLAIIARKFGVTVQALSLENNITNPAMVRAGQVLKIPGTRNSSRPTTTAAKTSPTTPPASAADTPAAPATTAPSPATTPASTTPVTRFEIAPPPPGEDLDASLKGTANQVPTVQIPTVTVPAEQPGKK